MLELFSSFTSTIFFLVRLVVNVVSGLVRFIGYVFQFLNYALVLVGYVPAPLFVFLLVGVTCSALMLIIGRN